MLLPNVQSAIVSREKIVDYLVNPEHPDGAGKAAFFTAMGFRADRWQDLANALLELAKSQPVFATLASAHGSKYIVDGAIDTPSGRSVTVRSVWIVDHEGLTPRLVTAYPHQ